MMKNKDAQALARKKWHGVSKAKRKAIMAPLSAARWRGKTEADRKGMGEMLAKARIKAWEKKTGKKYQPPVKKAFKKRRRKSIKKPRKKSEKYKAVHMALSRDCGKARFCQNKLCQRTSKQFEWALIKDRKYSRNPDDYFWLCKPCHTAYDFKNAQIIPQNWAKTAVHN